MTSAAATLPTPLNTFAVETEPPPPSVRKGAPRWQDALFEGTTRFFALLVLCSLLAILIALSISAVPAIQKFGLGFFVADVWNPVTKNFGALAPIYGTLVTSAIALLIGVPVSFGIALFLTEMCPATLKRPLGTAVELLAAIPSIIYGMWGLFVFAPFFGDYIQPLLTKTLGNVWLIAPLFQGAPNGIGVLSAGVILAIMVIPFIASVMRDVFEIVPPVLKESAYGIGCTTWEVVWNIVLPYTRVGVIGGVMLGLGRALGETMAVTFVIGNAYRISASLFAPGNSIASALANEFNEAADPVHSAALIMLGLVLFLLTFIVLACSRLLLAQLAKGEGEEDMSTPMNNLYRRRLFVNRFNLAASLGTMAFGMGFLLWILSVLFIKGFEALSPMLFVQMTPPPGSAGGLANAIFGSVMIVGVATFISTPIGVLAGIYLAEYGKDGWIARSTRFINDILLSAPSIVIGLFIYTIYVAKTEHFSGWAGSFALALIAVPVVVRTTENMLHLVPASLREAAVALGAPMWKVILMVTLRAVRGGVITGVLLAVARISGETAPLLFTALNNQFWSADMNAPMANLPVVIFQFALSPFTEWQDLAWAGALLITLAVLILNILARSVFRQASVR